MKKLMALALYCTLTPVVAAQSLVHSLIPITDPMKRLHLHAASLGYNASLTNFTVKAGGYGGNERIGKLIYSEMPGTLAALNVSRDPSTGACFLKNHNVIIKNHDGQQTINFPCISPDPDHSNLYWNADLGAVNGGYSPENDTLYASDVISNMFMEWYGIPPLKDEDGLPKPITIFLHDHVDNAYFNEDGSIDIGDGYNIFYPLTSLTTIGYMIGGLFTQQNSHLNWLDSQSGGIDVAFSCMSAMAAEFYATGKNTWQVGADIAKDGQALHYLDFPSKNCNGRKTGEWCDIDTLAQYRDNLSNFEASGLFNRAFYLLATTNGWDTHKAYNVFVQANRFHWGYSTRFQNGACGVVQSAKEIGYDTMAVMKAFSGVGIDTRDCSK